MGIVHGGCMLYVHVDVCVLCTHVTVCVCWCWGFSWLASARGPGDGVEPVSRPKSAGGTRVSPITGLATSPVTPLSPEGDAPARPRTSPVPAGTGVRTGVRPSPLGMEALVGAARASGCEVDGLDVTLECGVCVRVRRGVACMLRACVLCARLRACRAMRADSGRARALRAELPVSCL